MYRPQENEVPMWQMWLGRKPWKWATHLPTYSPTRLPTCSPTHLLTYSPTYLLTYPPTHLLTYPPTHTLTYQPTHLPRLAFALPIRLVIDDIFEHEIIDVKFTVVESDNKVEIWWQKCSHFGLSYTKVWAETSPTLLLIYKPTHLSTYPPTHLPTYSQTHIPT